MPSATDNAVLVSREHSRLSSQVSTVTRLAGEPYSTKAAKRLQQIAKTWGEVLAYEQQASQVVSAMESLVQAYEQQEGVDDALMEVQFAPGMYKSAQWSWCRQQYPGVSITDFAPELHKTVLILRRLCANGDGFPLNSPLRDPLSVPSKLLPPCHLGAL